MQVPENTPREALLDALARVDSVCRYYDGERASQAPVSAMVSDIDSQLVEALTPVVREPFSLESLRQANAQSVGWLRQDD